MKLKEFLKDNGITIDSFAETTGLTTSQVANALYGRPVGLHVALEIEKATFGRVLPRDLAYKTNSKEDKPSKR